MRISVVMLLCLVCLVSAQAQSPASQPASSQPAIVFTEEDIQYVYDRDILIPAKGVKASSLKNTYRLGEKPHRAIDIMAPKNTPLLAVADGSILKLHYSKAGGITIYLLDDHGSIVYYYAHLSKYETGLKEGQKVKRGDVIGYVGTSGNAKGRLPHVHFSIFKVANTKKWWVAAAINPYYVLTKTDYPEDEPPSGPTP